MFSFRVLFIFNISFPTNKLAMDVESVTQKRSRPCPLKLLKLSAFLALKILVSKTGPAALEVSNYQGLARAVLELIKWGNLTPQSSRFGPRNHHWRVKGHECDRKVRPLPSRAHPRSCWDRKSLGWSNESFFCGVEDQVKLRGSWFSNLIKTVYFALATKVNIYFFPSSRSIDIYGHYNRSLSLAPRLDGFSSDVQRRRGCWLMVFHGANFDASPNSNLISRLLRAAATSLVRASVTSQLSLR